MDFIVAEPRCFRHPIVQQFLEVSELSFDTSYGPKMKEGWCFTWTDSWGAYWRRRITFLLWIVVGFFVLYLMIIEFLR